MSMTAELFVRQRYLEPVEKTNVELPGGRIMREQTTMAAVMDRYGYNFWDRMSRTSPDRAPLLVAFHEAGHQQPDLLASKKIGVS
jgi:hypothetical protein